MYVNLTGLIKAGAVLPMMEDDPKELERTLKLVSTVTNVPISDIKGQRRKTPINIARKIYMALADDLLGDDYSLKQIGAVVNRNHATVINARHSIGYMRTFQRDEKSRHVLKLYERAHNLM